MTAPQKKLFLLGLGGAVGLYAYMTLLLGPLAREKDQMEKSIASLEEKLGNSSLQLRQAERAEQKAAALVERYKDLSAGIPKGSPVARIPPLLKEFFNDHGIESGRISQSNVFSPRDPALERYLSHEWGVALPGFDFLQLPGALGALEEKLPLTSVKSIKIQAQPGDPERQIAALVVSTLLERSESN